MKRSGFIEDQIIGVLEEHEAGISVADLCCKHGASDATVYKWKAKYGGMDVSDAKRLKGTENENARIRRLLADAMLDNAPHCSFCFSLFHNCNSGQCDKYPIRLLSIKAAQ